MTMAHEDHEAISDMARSAVYGVDYERFAEMTTEELWDELHPDLFGEALNMARFENFEAVEISDSIYEAISEHHSARYGELMQDGLI